MRVPQLGHLCTPLRHFSSIALAGKYTISGNARHRKDMYLDMGRIDLMAR